jgi:hypothetical protein
MSPEVSERSLEDAIESGLLQHGLGDRTGTCIDPKTQIVQGKTVCVVSCQRSPEPVFLKWKEMEASLGGDFFVRSGSGTVKLPTKSANEYIRTRFGRAAKNTDHTGVPERRGRGWP